MIRFVLILSLMAFSGLTLAQKPGETDIAGDWRCTSSGLLTNGTTTTGTGIVIFTKQDEANYLWTSSIAAELEAPDGQIFQSNGSNKLSVTMRGAGKAILNGFELKLWTEKMSSTDSFQNIYKSTSKYRISRNTIVHISTSGNPDLQSYSSTCTR